MAHLGSNEVFVKMSAWFAEMFPEPEQMMVYGFHPCAMFLNRARYFDSLKIPNIGPSYFGGDFDGCWIVTFTRRDERHERFWAQHGLNPEARRAFPFHRPYDHYPPSRGRMEDDPLHQWITEVHRHLGVATP
jgi:hypothetical protein